MHKGDVRQLSEMSTTPPPHGVGVIGNVFDRGGGGGVLLILSKES